MDRDAHLLAGMATDPIDYKLPRIYTSQPPSKCVEMNLIYYDALKRNQKTCKCKM